MARHAKPIATGQDAAKATGQDAARASGGVPGRDPGKQAGNGTDTSAQVTTYSAHHRYRQLTRILRHLRDQLHQQQPQLAMPTSRMIDQLVANCPLGALQCDDWSQAVTQALQFLQQQLDPLHFDPTLFYRADCDAPLFPNEELFDPYDAWLFVRALLDLQLPSGR